MLSLPKAFNTLHFLVNRRLSSSVTRISDLRSSSGLCSVRVRKRRCINSSFSDFRFHCAPRTTTGREFLAQPRNFATYVPWKNIHSFTRCWRSFRENKNADRFRLNRRSLEQRYMSRTLVIVDQRKTLRYISAKQALFDFSKTHECEIISLVTSRRFAFAAAQSVCSVPQWSPSTKFCNQESNPHAPRNHKPIALVKISVFLFSFGSIKFKVYLTKQKHCQYDARSYRSCMHLERSLEQ